MNSTLGFPEVGARLLDELVGDDGETSFIGAPPEPHGGRARRGYGYVERDELDRVLLKDKEKNIVFLEKIIG